MVLGMLFFVVFEILSECIKGTSNVTMHHKSVKTTVRFYMFRKGMWISESYARNFNGLN